MVGRRGEGLGRELRKGKKWDRNGLRVEGGQEGG